MKKIIIFALLFLIGCTPDKSISTKAEEDKPVNVNCIKEIQTPYIDVCSPVYDQDMIYMGSSDRNIKSDIIDNRLLVEYNVNTNKFQTLFESQYKSANIQGIRINDNWLVWLDMEISGAQSNIYFMNRKTKEITKINTKDSSFIIPTLVDDSIYWIEEESTSNENKGSIKRYDCNTGKIEVISKLNSIGVHTHIEKNGHKLLWCDAKDNKTSYYIYDITTQQKDTIPATLSAVVNPILVGDYIVSTEATSHSEIGELYIYNTKTKENRHHERLINGYYKFNDLILCNDGLIVSLFTINEDLSITSKKVFNTGQDNYTVTNGKYVIFNKRNDKGNLLSIYAQDNQ